MYTYEHIQTYTCMCVGTYICIIPKEPQQKHRSTGGKKKSKTCVCVYMPHSTPNTCMHVQ